jgi:hypothetical protein
MGMGKRDRKKMHPNATSCTGPTTSQFGSRFSTYV